MCMYTTHLFCLAVQAGFYNDAVEFPAEKRTTLKGKNLFPWFSFRVDPFSEGDLSEVKSYITKTRLFKYIENFTTKNWKCSDKNSEIFLCFCSKHRLRVLIIEPPRRNHNLLFEQKKENVYPVNSSFTV